MDLPKSGRRNYSDVEVWYKPNINLKFIHTSLFIQVSTSCSRRSPPERQYPRFQSQGLKLHHHTHDESGLIVATVWWFMSNSDSESSTSIELDCCPWTSLASTFNTLDPLQLFFLPSSETVASHADQVGGSWDTRIIIDVPTWVWFYMLH